MTSGASFGRGTKSNIAWKALHLGCYLFMAFTCPTRAPREFAEVYSTALSDLRVQVPCERKVRTWNPPRGAAIRGAAGRLEDCEGRLILRLGNLLTISTDQGDRRGSSPGSHHGTPHLPWGSQLCACFTHRAALVLMLKPADVNCRRQGLESPAAGFQALEGICCRCYQAKPVTNVLP